MKSMHVAQVGLVFNAKSGLIELELNLPEGTEILSVFAKNSKDTDTGYTLWVTYLSPAEAFDRFKETEYPWLTYHFSIVECIYTKIEINEHKYINNIDLFNGLKNSTYAVFYKIGAILEN